MFAETGGRGPDAITAPASAQTNSIAQQPGFATWRLIRGSGSRVFGKQGFVSRPRPRAC